MTQPKKLRYSSVLCRRPSHNYIPCTDLQHCSCHMWAWCSTPRRPFRPPKYKLRVFWRSPRALFSLVAGSQQTCLAFLLASSPWYRHGSPGGGLVAASPILLPRPAPLRWFTAPDLCLWPHPVSGNENRCRGSMLVIAANVQVTRSPQSDSRDVPFPFARRRADHRSRPASILLAIAHYELPFSL